MKQGARLLVRTAVATASLLALSPSDAATSSWGQLTSGFWDIVSNWLPGIPNAGDDIVINSTAAPPITVTVRSDTANIGSLSVSDSILSIDAGIIDIAGAYNQTGSGYTFIDGGTLRLHSASFLQSLVLTDGILGGQATVTTASFDWRGGQLGESGFGGGTTIVNGPTTIDGTSAQAMHYGHTLNLNGTTVWTAGNGAISTGGFGQGTTTFNIGVGATFTDAGAADADGGKSLGYFADGKTNNFGTFNRYGLGTTGLTSFNNIGTLNAISGTIVFSGGKSSGVINNASGTKLIFGDTYFISGGTVNNAGSILSNGGSLIFDAAAQYGGKGAIEIATGGKVHFAGTANIASLVIGDGALNGPGTVTVDSFVCNVGCDISAKTTVTGTSVITSGAGVLFNNGALNGNVIWQAGNGSMAGTFSIGAGATLVDAGAEANSAGTKRIGTSFLDSITNAGVYVRNGVGITNVIAPFTNSGTVNVNSGTLRFDGGGTNTGSINVADSAKLEFSRGTFGVINGNIFNKGMLSVNGGYVTFSQSSTYAGSGGIQINSGRLGSELKTAITTSSLAVMGGTARFDGNVNTDKLIVGNGTLSALGALTATNLTWVGGQLGEVNRSGGSTTVIGLALIDGAKNQSLDYGHTMNLNGSTNWSAGNGTLWVNSEGYGALKIGQSAIFDDAGAADSIGTKGLGIGLSGVINNAGIYNRNGLGTTELGRITNTGTLNINSGALKLVSGGNNTGTINIINGAQLAISLGTFNVDSGAINNAGTLEVSSGTLNIADGEAYSGNGALNVSKSGTLKINAGTMSTRGNFSNSGIVTVEADATLTNHSSIFFNDGHLQGTGTVEAAGIDKLLTSKGAINPGATLQTGHLSVKGDLHLTDTSILDIDLASGSDFDLLTISGKFVAGGTLAIHHLDNAPPVVGEEFKILTFGQLASGTAFSSVISDQTDYQYDLIYGSGDISLRITAVPESNTLALMSLGMLIGGFVVRRAKHDRLCEKIGVSA